MTEDDAPRVALLSQAVHGPQHDSAAEWRHAAIPSNRARRYVALRGDELVAYGALWTEAWYEHRRQRALELLVQPEHRRQGIGSALFRQVSADFAATDALSLRARVSEDQPEGLAFLQCRGFREVEREWDLLLRTADADLSPLAPAQQRVARQGIRVTTLAEEAASGPDPLPAFHEIWSVLDAQQPGHEENEPPPFEPFAEWMRRQEPVWDGWFLAQAQGRYVGLSILTLRKAKPGWLFQNLTGVLPEYRRRGIASLLKILALRYARDRGYEIVWTTNTSTNAPILALNERLGFRRQVGWISLQRGSRTP